MRGCRWFVVVALVAACGKSEGGGSAGSGTGSPAKPDALDLTISKTSGEHSKDSGSETVAYVLDGTTLQWQRSSTGSYRQQGADQEGKVTLTADQLADLEHEVEADHLLDGGLAAFSQTGPYTVIEAHVRWHGKEGTWHLALGVVDLNEPMTAVTERLIRNLDAIAHP